MITTQHFVSMNEKNNNKYIDLKNARTDDQKEVMKQIIDDDVCPFCIENLSNYHKNPILHEGEYWLFTKNQWPYDGVKHQYLAIAKKHVEKLEELPPEAGAELFKYFSQLTKENEMKGGGVAMRFGPPNEHGSYGSTVAHLHAHLIEPDLENMEKDKFKFKFGQKYPN